MRAFFGGIITAVVCGAIWHASTTVSAQPQNVQAGITTGETVMVAFEPGIPGYGCVVTEVRGDFLGCKSDTSIPGRTTYEHWYNLRLVSRVDRPAKP